MIFPFSFQSSFLNVCHDALRQVDQAALENASCENNDGGGPFAAMLTLVTENGDIEPMTAPCGNHVLCSGIASCHAEHEALSPPSYEKLAQRLEKEKNAFVALFSSAQSCTACHAKQEIIARDLIRRGLLARGHFLSIYGASYDETLTIAGFNDKIYAEALILAAEEPQKKNPLFSHRAIPLKEAPSAVQKALAQTSALVAREQEVYALGQDERTAYDLFSTAEIRALQNACLRYRQEGHTDSWTVSGALYTTTQSVGPLLFAEMGWTGITEIISVQMPDGSQTQETPDLSNDEFLKIVAGGYAHPQRAIHVFQDASYENKAQTFWNQRKDRQLYNGAACCPMDKTFAALVSERFTAPLLSAVAVAE